MVKTQEELNALKEEYETLTNKLKELTDDELQMVVGGVIDFQIPIDDDVTHYLTTAYEDIKRHGKDYYCMGYACNCVENALKSDNKKDRLDYTIKAISFLEFEPIKDYTFNIIMSSLTMAKYLLNNMK